MSAEHLFGFVALAALLPTCALLLRAALRESARAGRAAEADGEHGSAEVAGDVQQPIVERRSVTQ